MKKRTQLAALLLALLTVTPAIASCAEKTEDEGNITDAAVTDISTEPVVTSAMDTIETQNLDGYKFRVILDNGDNRHLDFETEGKETGEVFNDIVHCCSAVYRAMKWPMKCTSALPMPLLWHPVT